ncbi:MAG: metallophosphoesterase [Rhodospirillaceae bacterium]|nr:metallophosphoesterase [Rhodospirillaceae bacterium]
MPLITRRRVLVGMGAGAAAAFGLGGYALAVEPYLRLVVTPYDLPLAGWSGPPLTIAALADLHICEPYMTADRVAEIVAATDRLGADLVVLLGDFARGIARFGAEDVAVDAWAAALAGLSAPLGVYAVLGNHDWWSGPDVVRAGLRAAGIVLLENAAVKLEARGHRLWLAGLGDQWAFGSQRGVDDLPGTLAQVRDGDPVVLLVHEPDIFPRVPPRVAVTLAGHTHGGQVRIPFYGPVVVPSRFGARFAYGHIVEGGRPLIVSGGLGMTGLPIRFGVPPEIVLVTLRGA